MTAANWSPAPRLMPRTHVRLTTIVRFQAGRAGRESPETCVVQVGSMGSYPQHDCPPHQNRTVPTRVCPAQHHGFTTTASTSIPAELRLILSLDPFLLQPPEKTRKKDRLANWFPDISWGVSMQRKELLLCLRSLTKISKNALERLY
jgi:hypothetical protein